MTVMIISDHGEKKKTLKLYKSFQMLTKVMEDQRLRNYKHLGSYLTDILLFRGRSSRLLFESFRNHYKNAVVTGFCIDDESERIKSLPWRFL